MKVSGEILKQLTEAFLDAFDRESLARFVRERLDERLDDIVQRGTMPSQVHAFLEWAQRQGRLDEVVQAAAREIPGNRGLQRAVAVLPNSLNRPEPAYADDATRELSESLEQAYRRKANLSAEGRDIAQVTEEILSLRRRLRQGAQLNAGDYLSDRFQLVEEIGHGGFAQVWKAYDVQGHSLVAVKVLHGQHTRDHSRRERFFRGARHMARLAHPNVVRVIEDHCEDGGYPFFVMEYLAGGDFRQAVLEGRLSLEERLDIVLEVGYALAFAHGRGVVHRDVKPHNILLAVDGSPKLTDFDLVRAADTTGGTRTAMLGTFLYASPEAMADARKAAEPADVYGLGMTAIFALYGSDLPSDVLWELPELVAGLDASARCRDVLLRSVARKLPDRFARVEEYCAALREATSPSTKVRTEASPSSVSDLDSAPIPFLPSSDRERLHELDGSLLVYVPGGQFTLGTNEDLKGFREEWQQWWKPEHTVKLGGFWIGKYPVTNEQYERFLTATGHSQPAFWSEERFTGSKQPVVGVSWLDAKAYCDWACLKLPTEAQWEAAARGTDRRPYPWGEEALTAEHADFDKNYQTDQPDPVGSHPHGAGPFGVEDQAGCVWEWCLDEFDAKAYRGRDGRTNPMVKPKDANSETADRVLRGGSWAYQAQSLHAAIRFRYPAGLRVQLIGFRVCWLGPEP